MNQARILIVEDESLVAADLADRLQELGYDVPAIADSAVEAIIKAVELEPDLVLMDIQLIGHRSGIEAADSIRRNLRTPVVFLTAHGCADTVERATAAEPYGYILKPFDERQLQATIQTALARAKAEAKLRKLERWLATSLKSMGDGVIATDTQ